jgi:hypothetical protein
MTNYTCSEFINMQIEKSSTPDLAGELKSKSGINKIKIKKKMCCIYLEKKRE